MSKSTRRRKYSQKRKCRVDTTLAVRPLEHQFPEHCQHNGRATKHRTAPGWVIEPSASLIVNAISPRASLCTMDVIINPSVIDGVDAASCPTIAFQDVAHARTAATMIVTTSHHFSK